MNERLKKKWIQIMKDVERDAAETKKPVESGRSHTQRSSVETMESMILTATNQSNRVLISSDKNGVVSKKINEDDCDVDEFSWGEW
jgi:hypothetical protein